jgi:hypothetical protein
MYRMLKSSYFGNRFRIFDNEKEFIDAVENGFDRFVGVRCAGKPGLPYYHHKTFVEAISIGRRLREKFGCDVKYYECSPDEHIILQGEYCESELGSMLEWSSIRTHMREAFSLERNSLLGPGARLILKRVMSEGSYDDLMELCRLYPGSIIEFTVYEIFVGNLKGRNVVVWEVRNY